MCPIRTGLINSSAPLPHPTLQKNLPFVRAHENGAPAWRRIRRLFIRTEWNWELALCLRKTVKDNGGEPNLLIVYEPSVKRRYETMYLSRLTFHTLPGKTHEVEEGLDTLLKWVEHAGGSRSRIMRTHYGSLGAPDLVFEQEG